MTWQCYLGIFIVSTTALLGCGDEGPATGGSAGSSSSTSATSSATSSTASNTGGTGGSGASTASGFSLSAGDTGEQFGTRLAVDASGDIFVSGKVEGAIDLGGGPLVAAAGARDGFVARLDADGGHLWSRRLGATNTVGYVELAIDASGDLLCAANFTGSLDLGGSVITSAGAADVVVAKLAGATGSLLWATRLAGVGDAFIGGVAAGPGGSVFVSGLFQGTLDPGFGVPLTAQGGGDVFLVGFAGDGQGLWSKRLGGPGAVDHASDVSVSDDGSLMLAGTFGGSADFGGGPVTSAGTEDIFVARYDALTGTFLDVNAFAFQGTGYLDGFAGGARPDGSVVLVGNFGDAVTFGPFSLVGHGKGAGNDLFVAGLGADLEPTFATAYGASGENHFRGFGLGPSGSISFGSVGAASFGGEELDPGSVGIVRLGVDGGHLTSRLLGSYEIGVEDVAEAADGAWLVTGFITEPVDLGYGLMSHAGGTDFFLARIAP